ERILLGLLVGGVLVGCVLVDLVGHVGLDGVVALGGVLRGDVGLVRALLEIRGGVGLDLGELSGVLGRGGVGLRGGGEGEGVVDVLVGLVGGRGLVTHRREPAFLAAGD